MYKIDKNVPIPPPRAAWPKYPFEQLLVGDSFGVPIHEDKAAAAKQKKSVRSSARQCALKTGLRFTCRTIYDASGREKEIRVWRIE